MTYASELAAIQRTPVTLAVITLDYCSLTYGIAPCTASGSPGSECYNTFPTCQAPAAFSKTAKQYKFTSAEIPLPFPGPRPYVKSCKYLPTEIKDNLTINGQVFLEFYDEPDTDIGIDPYVANRATTQGTFWKKLLARNINYKGRAIEIYEGFAKLGEGDYAKKFAGIIDNIAAGSGAVKIEIADLLKKLDKIEAPPKLDIKLIVAIDASISIVGLNSASGLDDPAGYVKIDDEIIYYTAVNTETNQLTGCTRAYFSTVAASHNLYAKVQKVRYFAPDNPFNILKTMLLSDAAIPAAEVDSTNFNYWRDNPGGEINFSAVISKPIGLDKLYFEILDLIDCKSWVGEDLKITIKRNMPNWPGRSYYNISDAANIISNSGSVDLNEKSRISRCLLYWDILTLGDQDDVNSYNRLDIAVDASAEGANEYNDNIEKIIYSRWIQEGLDTEEALAAYVKNTIGRLVWTRRDARPLIKLDVELKDSDIKTGEHAKVSSDELLQPDGNPLSAAFQVIKRELKGARTSLTLLEMPRRFAFVADNASPAYSAATEAEKEYGFITDNDGKINNRYGYYVW